MSGALRFTRLELFCKVASFGSFTKAAVMMDTLPSAISRQITMLESEFGGRLFHRTGRGVTLTDLGQRVLPRVQNLIEDADALNKELKGQSNIPSGEVRIGILASTASTLVPNLFRRITSQYPDISLRILEGSTGQLDEWVSVGRIDIALVVRQGRAMVAEEHPLTLSQSYLIGPASSPIMRGESLDFRRLDGVPLILPGLPNGLRATLAQISKSKDVRLNIVMEADSMNVQIAMVEQDCGYTILPRHAVLKELAEGRLKAVRIVNPEIERTITLTTTRQKPLTLAGREVFRAIRHIIEELSNEMRPGDLWKRQAEGKLMNKETEED